jgi:hypothetical protein
MGLCLVLLLPGHLPGGTVEIGSGTTYTRYLPVYGSYDYGWSQVLYEQSEIGGTYVITGISYNVYNSPSGYTMNNQKVYMAVRPLDGFSDASYEDPETDSFSKVFDGSVTWDGSGWQTISLNTPFVYDSTGNLAIQWENRDGSFSSGYPTFRCTTSSARAKYDYRDGSFPDGTGRMYNYRPNIRLHWSSTGPWVAGNLQPTDQERSVAVNANPTLSWSNHADVLHNAVYFSTNYSDVAATSLTARVLYDGSTIFSDYTHGSDLLPGVTYYWNVVQEFSTHTTCEEPFSFTTEPPAQSTYPWQEGFESGGVLPAFWNEEFISGSARWAFQSGGLSGTPANAAEGSYNAVFGGAGGGAKTMLIAPRLDLSGTTEPILSFRHAQAAGFGGTDTLQVYYRTTPTGAWTSVPGGSFSGSVEEWTRRTLILPDPSATYYIAFEGTDNGGAGICLDDVAVRTEYGSVRFTVFDQYGDPLRAAPFEVYAPSDAGTPLESGETDGSGEAFMTGIEAGTLRYRVDEAFHNMAEGTLSVSDGEVVTRQVDLVAAAHLSGVVRAVDENGQRIEGAVVNLYTPAPESELVASDSTDAFGQYRFSRVADGDYDLAAAHPAYSPVTTGITVAASTSHTLVMEPLPGNYFDVYIQVNGVLSGWPITGTDVELTVQESTGLVIYQDSGLTDEDGNITFRGVPAGLATFKCNQPGLFHQPWWESFTSTPEAVANAKMVHIRLEPRKSATVVDLEFDATDAWGNTVDPAPYVQNFWIEARGYDPDTDTTLYPARTALSDENGSVTFAQLPTLPTRITVRRPGFEETHVDLVPDNTPEFPPLITLDRPAITHGTAWNLQIDQDLFASMENVENYPPVIEVTGLPRSNTEGFAQTERYATLNSSTNPVDIATSHDEMSAWGQGQYRVAPGREGSVDLADGQAAYIRYDFAPQLVTLVEGETNTHVINAAIPPGKLEGTLFAADEFTEDGLRLYKPVAGMEIQFVMHESVRHNYKPGHEVFETVTDTNGAYRIQLPPGVYGITISGMPGYWGYSTEAKSIVGWSDYSGGWPYAFTNNYIPNGNRAHVFNFDGFSLSSGHHAEMNLYVHHHNRYAIETPVIDDGPASTRLLYRAPDGSFTRNRTVEDTLETETGLLLSGGQQAAIRQGAYGLHAVWTNLTAANFTVSGSTHGYLSSTSDVSHAAFDWGNFPGDLMPTQPPYDDDLTDTPLPMVRFQTDEYHLESTETLTSAPAVTVTYATGNEENPIDSTTAQPSYVEYTDLTNKVYYGSSNVDRSRVSRYFVDFTLMDGTRNVYAVPGGGPYAVNTITESPVAMPTDPFTMNVTAVDMDAPSLSITNFPFRYDTTSYTAPKTFSGLTEVLNVAWDDDATTAWQKESIKYAMATNTSPLTIDCTLFCRPKVKVQGTVKNAVSGLPVKDAVIELVQADSVSKNIMKTTSYSSGNFSYSFVYSRQAHLLKVTAPGYLPFTERYVLMDYITTTGDYFTADLGDIHLTPAAVQVTKDSWNRQGTVLHGVQSAGSADQPETTEAVTLTVESSAFIPAQTYSTVGYDAPDGTPTTPEIQNWQDEITEIWLVDARYPDAEGNGQPYAAATSSDYYPQSSTHLPPASDPEKIRQWLDQVTTDKQVMMKTVLSSPSASVSATGTVSLATLHPGIVVPVLVARTKADAFAMLSVDDANLTSMALPRWLAFAADTFAGAAAAQASYSDLKETYASKVPDGKLSALPSLSGGISESGGYLSYDYELGIAWEEGAKAPAEGGLSIGPGLLGLNFEAGSKIGFNGQNQVLTFEVGGTVGKEELDLKDYAPGFVKALDIEGQINQVSGEASTRRSTALTGDQWDERELSTSVGASVDLTLRYNLKGITGTIPYVGPMLVLADKTGTLQLFGRLDTGARLQNLSTWRTVEPNRSQEVGQPEANPSASAPITARPDDLALTPNRHCLGGQENNSGSYSNQFDLGLHFGAGFEGSGLGEHLNVHAGIEITGNEDDLVAGKPSLVITPNTYGDWPPIKRVQGDVNAFLRATLDAYVTEIEKDWTINLARINYEYTTESSLTMADVAVNVVERPVESTVFTGVRPTVVRNLPKGSSFALSDGLLAFGHYDEALQRTDLKVSLADGNGYAATVTVAQNVEGLGLVHLAAIGPSDYLLTWEERPGLNSNPAAYSEIHSAVYSGSAWQTPQLVAPLYSYLCDMELFASAHTNSLVYLQSPDYYDRTDTSIRAVNYNKNTDVWSTPVTVQSLSEKRDVTLACAGYTSVEPGRLLSITGTNGVSSMYWDGTRSSVPGGVERVPVESGSALRTVLSAEGTNETLWVSTLTEAGDLLLHRYAIDPARDPLDPAYDWNGRDAAAMWPAVTNLTRDTVTVLDLANGCLPEADQLLTVWSVLGNLRGQWFGTGTRNIGSSVHIAGSFSGSYDDIQITAHDSTFARVAAVYKAPDIRDLRVFDIEAQAAQNTEDADDDGIPDRLEQALVDADPDDALTDIRDVHGADDFDGDGFDNATEWAAGTRADLAASRPSTGIEINVALMQAREDGLLPGSFLIARAENDPATDALTVFYSIAGTATEGTDYQAIPRSVQLAAGESSATIHILPLSDDEVEGTETVAVTLLPDEDYVLGVDTQAVVNILDASHDDWRGGHFTPEELDDPAIGGDDADPDGDGIPNRLEFALGTDPRVAGPKELEIIIDGDDLLLGYRYDPRVEDALITIQQSTNLLDSIWNPSSGTLLYREALPDQREEVFYHLFQETRRGFYRLRIE